MKCYTVVPNRDANGCLIKLENTAAASDYTKKEDAIQATFQLTRVNSPSLLIVLDDHLEVKDERVFEP